MLALEVFISVLVLAMIVAGIIFMLFYDQAKAGWRAFTNRLAYEKRVVESLSRHEREIDLAAHKAATKEVEDMSLHLGQKGDDSCP